METNGIRFGPAGNCEAFHAAGYKATEQVFAFLATWELHAYEYQCGRGVRLSERSAAAIRQQAEQYGVRVSLHAPYFISLASAEEEKRKNSIRYILDSARAVTALGGDRIVVHPGGLGGRSRPEATALAAETLKKFFQNMTGLTTLLTKASSAQPFFFSFCALFPERRSIPSASFTEQQT